MNRKKAIILLVTVILLAAVVAVYLYPQVGCNYNDPSKRYVSRSADECSLIRYVCNPGEQGFHDKCGCGCMQNP